MSAEPSDTSGTDFRGKLRSRKFISSDDVLDALVPAHRDEPTHHMAGGKEEKFDQTLRLIETVMPFITAVVGAYIGFNYISQKKRSEEIPPSKRPAWLSTTSETASERN